MFGMASLGRKRISRFIRFVIAIAFIGSLSAQSFLGFDIGHHTDISRASLRRMGYSNDVSDAIILQNWITDLYGNWPLWSVGSAVPIPPKHKWEMRALGTTLEKLHFDNLRDEDRVAAYWEQLVLNTRQAIRTYASEPPIEASSDLFTTLAVTLHAVQDFYAHSNWVECYGRTDPNGPFDTRTWFNLRQSGDLPPCHNRKDKIRTGSYKNTEFPNTYSPSHDELNKDRYSRDAEKWAQAYVYAYAASVQWIRAFENWAMEINSPHPLSEFKTMAYCGKDADFLQRDLRRSYEIQAWFPIGGGHWKGTGSGSFVKFSVPLIKWAKDPSSSFKSQFVDNWRYLILAKDLYKRLAPVNTNFGIPSAPLNETAVIVKTIAAANWSTPKHNNMFAKIRFEIDGSSAQEFVESVQRDTTSGDQWPWYTIYFAPNNTQKISIKYELHSEDDPIDYRMHIYPRPDRDHLSFDFYPATNSSQGDIMGVHATNATAVSNVPYAAQSQNPASINEGRVDARLRLVINRRTLN